MSSFDRFRLIAEHWTEERLESQVTRIFPKFSKAQKQLLCFLASSILLILLIENFTLLRLLFQNILFFSPISLPLLIERAGHYGYPHSLSSSNKLFSSDIIFVAFRIRATTAAETVKRIPGVVRETHS